jgi:hypothetical protein
MYARAQRYIRQFEHINEQVSAYRRQIQLAIAVDTKRKDLIEWNYSIAPNCSGQLGTAP